MTFKETELLDLISILKKISQEVVLDKNLIESIYQMFEKIPIYPGIVISCLENLTKNTGIENLKIGEVVKIETAFGIFQGEINDITEKEVILKNVTFQRNIEESSIDVSEIKNIKKIDLKILEDKWGSIIKK